MAEQQPIGKALLISNDVIKRLDEADKRINKIADDSDNMAKSFTSAMTKMSGSTDNLLTKLEKINTIIGGLGKINASGLNSMSNSLNKTSSEAEKVANSVTKAAVSINKFGGADFSSSIKEMLSELSKLNEDIKLYRTSIGTGKKTYIEFGQQGLKEATKRADELMRSITALEEAQKRLGQSRYIFSDYIDDLNGASLAARRQSDELKKLNQYFSELENTSAREAKAAEAAAQREEKSRQKALAAAEKAAEKKAIAAEKAAQQEIKAQQRVAAENERSYKRQAANYRQQNYKQNTTVEGSLAFAESANTIARRTQAVQYLTEARKNLSATDANYNVKLKQLNANIKKMNELNSEAVEGSKEVKESHNDLMNTSEQLAQKIALVFSVSQIQGYIEKLIRVRGEFELQNAALASILQNKEKADMLFERIKDLAIQSPFTLMQLNTYTKQLAAYSVEYEKLYDTTKMLADVSAGLGVDMQRLILAFGQVKAANFLRGTETRQFTEAGINMLGELAKYYSELEGRIVSVGEVQERQFKRMISFADVEEVFKRLTSASGMFYNMQEKQAQTLAGQVSNLQDSIDIMLNDIGEEHQGLLSGIISTIKELIQNWRTIAAVVEPIVTMLIAQQIAVKGIIPFVLYLRKSFNTVTASIRGATVAQQGFNAASKLNSWITIGTVVVAVILEVANAIKEAKREQEKLNEITSEGYYESLNLSSKYERLANVVASSTASYQEQKDALDELKRTYSEILPQHYLEADAIKAMKGNYDEATAAIKNYIRAKTEEKAIQQINEFENEKISKSQENLAEVIQKQISNSTKYKLSISEINNQLALFRDAFDKGLIKSVDDAENKLNELFSKYLNQDIKLFNAKEGSDYGRLISYYARIAEYQKKINEVSQQGQLNFGDRITQQLQKQREEVETQIKEANSLLDLIANKYSGGAGSELITDKQVSDAKTRLIELGNAWDFPIEKIKQLKGGAYEISEISSQIKVAALKSFANEIRNMKLPTNQLASAQMYLQGIQKEIDGLNATPFQNYISNIIISLAQLNKVSLDGLVDAFAKAGESIDDYSKRIAGKAETLRESLRLFAVSPYLVPEWGGSKQKAEEAEKILKVYEGISKSVTPVSDKDIKKRQAAANKAQKSELDKLKERIDLIKKARDEYEKLLQYYDKGEAKLRVTNAFSDSFKDASLSIDMDFDISGVITKISNLANKAGKEGAKAINEAVSNLKTERDIKFREEGLDEIQSKVDKIFSDYEFTLDMKTSGIDLNAFKNMLKSVGASDKEIGALGLNTTSFDDAQKELRKIIEDLQEQGGEKQIEAAKKFQKQLTDLEVKEARKRFDELLKLREKYQSNEAKIAKVESDMSGWEKELAKYNNAITSRDTLSAMLADGIYSDESKKKIEDKIKELNDFINSEQKELLELQIQNGKDTILQLKSEALQLTDFWRQLFGDLGDLSVSSLRDLSRIVDEIISSSKEIKGSKGETSGYSASYKDRNGITQQVTLTVEQYQRLLKQNNSVADEIEEKNPFIALFDAITKGKNKGETTLDYITRLEGIFESVSSAAFDIANNIADIFSADEDAKQMISNIQDIANGVVSLGTGIARISSGDVLGGITSSIKGLASISKAITDIHDSKKEKEIERQQELVESLERSYQKLYDTIENGLSIDTYSQNAALIQNLQKQVNSYQAMIAAEQDKKNTDNDKIRDWQNSIEDIYSQMEELYDNLKTSLIGDFKSISEQLGDAIAEAFREGEDAAEAWGESVNDIVADIVKNLLVQKLIEPKVQEIVDQMFASALPNTNAAAETQKKINSLQEEYSKLLQEQASGFTSVEQINSWKKRKDEIERQIAELQKQYDELNAASEGEIPNITQDIIDKTLGSLTDLGEEVINNPAWDMLKDLLQGSGDTMSGLQKGIEGLSESTGEALEALLNSMRFYVADTNTDIKNIYNFLVNTPIESPLMQELKIQSNYLSSISSLLNSVSKNVQANGRAIKVQIV